MGLHGEAVRGQRSYCGCVVLQMPLELFFWAKRGIDVKLNMKGIHYIYTESTKDETKKKKEEANATGQRTKKGDLKYVGESE